MKLALITNYWINSDGGGVRNFTKNFVDCLKEKMDVIVFFREGEDPKNHKLPMNKQKFISSAKRFLFKEKPDVILSQGGWFTILPAIHYKNKHKTTKVFYLFHSHFDQALPVYKRIIYRRLLSKCDKVGFVSRGLRKNIITVGKIKFNAPTFILYPAVKVTSVSELSLSLFRKRFGIDENHIYILGLGLTAIYAKKEGAKLLMRSFKRVRVKYPKTKLILTRKGGFLDELKKFAHHEGLDKYVIFTEDIDNPYLAIISANIYTHISYGEGLPSALLEVMAFGKPIIASKVGGIPEAITHMENGLLVENNEKSISDWIIKLIENKDLADRLGKNALKTAETKFTWDNTVTKFIKIIGIK